MPLTYTQHTAAVAARAVLALAAAQVVDAAFELHQRVNEVLWKPRGDLKGLDVWSDAGPTRRLHQGGSAIVHHFPLLRIDILVPHGELGAEAILYDVADALTPVFLAGTDALGFGVTPGAGSSPGSGPVSDTPDLTTPRHSGQHWIAQARYPYDWLRLVA